MASYGRQLGRLLEAVDVLVQRQSRRGLEGGGSPRDHVDRIVAYVRALIGDQQANVDAIRQSLPEQ